MQFFNPETEEKTLSVKMCHKIRKFVSRSLDAETSFAGEMRIIGSENKAGAALVRLRCEGNALKAVCRHMATLILIYCKKTFIIAVERVVDKGEACPSPIWDKNLGPREAVEEFTLLRASDPASQTSLRKQSKSLHIFSYRASGAA